MNEIIRSIEQKQLRTDLPKISIGDTVRVWVKVVEGSRERLQAFEGVVIAMRNGFSWPTAALFAGMNPCRRRNSEFRQSLPASACCNANACHTLERSRTRYKAKYLP